MSHDTIEQLIVAHATHSLDPGTESHAEREILEHVAGCDECRTLFIDMRAVSGDLALAAPAMRAPAYLEQRILSTIRGEQVRTTARRDRSLSLRVASIAAAFMLVAVGGFATFAASISGRLAREERRNEATAHALSVVTHQDAKSTTLAGGSGSVLFAYAPGGRAVLLGNGLAALPKGRVLELWLIRDGVPQPVEIFTPSQGMAVVPVQITPTAGDTIAITVEARKVDKPTSAPIYSARLA